MDLQGAEEENISTNTVDVAAAKEDKEEEEEQSVSGLKDFRRENISLEHMETETGKKSLDPQKSQNSSSEAEASLTKSSLLDETEALLAQTEELMVNNLEDVPGEPPRAADSNSNSLYHDNTVETPISMNAKTSTEVVMPSFSLDDANSLSSQKHDGLSKLTQVQEIRTYILSMNVALSHVSMYR